MSAQSNPATPEQLVAREDGPPGNQGQLDRGLGVGAIVFMVVAGAAPLGGAVAVFPVVIGVSQSTVSPLFFIVAAIALAVFAVGFTRMARHVKEAGAFYSYIQAGLGRFTGGGAAILALVSYLMLFVALGAYLGAVTAGTIEQFGGPTAPWWVWSGVWLAVTGLLSYRDITLSSKVLGVALVLEIAIMLVLDAAMIVTGGAQGLTAASLNPVHFTEGIPSLGVMFAFFGFIGFEATAVFRSEARDPDRTIPRATYIAVIGIGLFYAFSLFAVTIGAGTLDVVTLATSSPQTLVSDLAGRYLGVAAQQAFQIMILTSVFACFLTFHNVLTRYAFNLGAAGVLPTVLNEVHPRHLAPSRASVVVTITGAAAILLVVILGLDPVAQIYTWLSGAATVGIISLMALTSVAVLVFFRGRNRQGWIASLVAPAVALLALVGLLALVVANFSLLVGGDTAAIVLLAVLCAAFVGGVVATIRGPKPATAPEGLPASAATEPS